MEAMITRKPPRRHWFGFGGTGQKSPGGGFGLPFYIDSKENLEKKRQISAGKARRRQRQYEAWEAWGGRAMITAKNAVRKDRGIKREELLRFVNEVLRSEEGKVPEERWLETTIDYWAKKFTQKSKRFQKIATHQLG